MIQAITGLMNSGKTLYQSYLLFLDYCLGRTIITNYDVAFPHYKINEDWLIDIATKDYVVTNTSFGFDELWIWLDSRGAMSYSNKIASYFFLQSSKDDSNIYITAQDNTQNEIRIRKNLHRISQCSRVLYLDNEFKNISSDRRVLPISEQKVLYIKVLDYKRVLQGLTTEIVHTQTKYIKAQPIFMLYDTFKKVIKTERNT